MLVCLDDAGLGRGGRHHLAARVSAGLPYERTAPERMHAVCRGSTPRPNAAVTQRASLGMLIRRQGFWPFRHPDTAPKTHSGRQSPKLYGSEPCRHRPR